MVKITVGLIVGPLGAVDQTGTGYSGTDRQGDWWGEERQTN